jgi:hypothetical protein
MKRQPAIMLENLKSFIFILLFLLNYTAKLAVNSGKIWEKTCAGRYLSMCNPQATLRSPAVMKIQPSGIADMHLRNS